MRIRTRMIRWIAVNLLAVLGIAHALGPEDPTYADLRFSYVESRLTKLPRLPFVEAVNAQAVEACKDKAGQERAQCLSSYTWRMPYSTTQATQEVARDIRKAWQRFEERYYWRVITELNNPAFYVPFCWLGLKGGDLNPPIPQAQVSVESSTIPQYPKDTDFRNRLQQALGPRVPPSSGSHSLDVYYPLPQIPTGDFCDGLSLNLLPIMYIPGFCINVSGFEWCTPGYYEDQPLWFNEGEAQARVNRAIQHAISNYYSEYLQEASRIASTPRIGATAPPNWYVYAPVLWKTNLLQGGAVIAPVAGDLKAPQDMANEVLQGVQGSWNAVMQARGAFPNEAQVLMTGYYAQSLLSLANTPGLSAIKSQLMGLLGGLDQKALEAARTGVEKADFLARLQDQRGYLAQEQKTGAPGVFPFEEVKRWFPLGNILLQERLGYVSTFQVYNRIDATVLPTPKDAMGAFGLFQRVIVYWWIPVKIYITFSPAPPFVSITGSLDWPKPKPVPPYVLPFMGERTYYAWENVPLGYPVPRVKGTPVFGGVYNNLLR